jgi:hypothetical protein
MRTGLQKVLVALPPAGPGQQLPDLREFGPVAVLDLSGHRAQSGAGPVGGERECGERGLVLGYHEIHERQIGGAEVGRQSAGRCSTARHQHRCGEEDPH